MSFHIFILIFLLNNNSEFAFNEQAAKLQKKMNLNTKTIVI